MSFVATAMAAMCFVALLGCKMPALAEPFTQFGVARPIKPIPRPAHWADLRTKNFDGGFSTSREFRLTASDVPAEYHVIVSNIFGDEPADWQSCEWCFEVAYQMVGSGYEWSICDAVVASFEDEDLMTPAFCHWLADFVEMKFCDDLRKEAAQYLEDEE